MEKATNKFVSLISHKSEGIILSKGKRVDEGCQARLGICTVYFDSRMCWLLLPPPGSTAAHRVCLCKTKFSFRHLFSAGRVCTHVRQDISPILCPQSAARYHAACVPAKALSSFVILSGFSVHHCFYNKNLAFWKAS